MCKSSWLEFAICRILLVTSEDSFKGRAEVQKKIRMCKSSWLEFVICRILSVTSEDPF